MATKRVDLTYDSTAGIKYNPGPVNLTLGGSENTITFSANGSDMTISIEDTLGKFFNDGTRKWQVKVLNGSTQSTPIINLQQQRTQQYSVTVGAQTYSDSPSKIIIGTVPIVTG